MTTQEFYNLAVMAAKEKGYENPIVTVHTLCDKSGINHICKLWDGNKYIDSKLQKNPVSAIMAFKDAIDFHLKTYSNLEEGVEN